MIIKLAVLLLNQLMFRLQGCGGSSTWEKPSNYKHPEVDIQKFIEKKEEKD